MKKFYIKEEERNWNLKKWTNFYLPWLNYSSLQKAVRKKNILIDSQKCDASSNLKEKKIISVLEKLTKSEPTSNEKKSEIIKKMKIYEDDDLIILNKPSGISSQGGEKVRIALTDLANYITIHRLDKETSGLMIMAKNKKTANKISKQFENREVEKEYQAICCGKIDPSSGTWNQAIFTKGKEQSGETKYQVLKQNGPFLLLKLNPKTGRMHQLRKHCALNGAPILGDKLYLGEKYKKLQLHCARIKFFHPTKLTHMEFLEKGNIQDNFKKVGAVGLEPTTR